MRRRLGSRRCATATPRAIECRMAGEVLWQGFAVVKGQLLLTPGRTVQWDLRGRLVAGVAPPGAVAAGRTIDFGNSTPLAIARGLLAEALPAADGSALSPASTNTGAWYMTYVVLHRDARREPESACVGIGVDPVRGSLRAARTERHIGARGRRLHQRARRAASARRVRGRVDGHDGRVVDGGPRPEFRSTCEPCDLDRRRRWTAATRTTCGERFIISARCGGDRLGADHGGQSRPRLIDA